MLKISIMMCHYPLLLLVATFFALIYSALYEAVWLFLEHDNIVYCMQKYIL